ncbi:uracil-DNA glycosylase [Geobacter benzoatilyticus]|uniref:Type-4 uracil-DNA glycosylase n=1 Tax=Geobacter benzoatilyticus TaxID=2815309 RepID=A0ABX7Q0D4_9BACT|nr:uracil-DNA glycosylase [Geobacter benzoatilyticus]QSV44530.1 uracil-DNA glycosylase [Geobacter benzoatilyticus]
MGNEGGSGAVASLRRYLEELKETGVVELPRAAVTGGEKTAPPLEASPVAESALPLPVAEPHAQAAAGETLDDIRSELGECVRCQLGSQRTNLVFGVGNPRARLVFIGEAPGREEDLKGEPFVGEAGQLLTKIIQAMGFARDEVYICNVLKCRPPGNRNPHHEEIEQCAPFMLRQVRAIAPEAVVALGTFAAQTLLATKEPISRLRGRFHDYHGIPLMPTFHPAFLVRNPERKREVWADMKQVMALMGKDVPGKKG